MRVNDVVALCHTNEHLNLAILQTIVGHQRGSIADSLMRCDALHSHVRRDVNVLVAALLVHQGVNIVNGITCGVGNLEHHGALLAACQTAILVLFVDGSIANDQCLTICAVSCLRQLSGRGILAVALVVTTGGALLIALLLAACGMLLVAAFLTFIGSLTDGGSNGSATYGAYQ